VSADTSITSHIHAIFVESNGTAHRVEAPIGKTLMQIAVENSIPGILGECGGSCSCATCHGYITQKWRTSLPTMTETESFMLEIVLAPREDSRLCCQIKMTPELNEIVIQLPHEQG
jgi:ferredoxin, 2Fe-2S